MASYQKILLDVSRQLPNMLFEKLITKKLTAAKVPQPEKIAPKILAHILTGHTEPFKWTDEGEQSIGNVSIVISEEDLEEFSVSVRSFTKNELPNVIRNVSDETAESILSTLKKTWADHVAWEEATNALFQEHLYARWGKAFDLLGMLLTMSREIGEKQFKRYRRTKGCHLRDVLLRLHARACQVAAEIITLMQNGFADGAMARWRTLHEICVVATVIADFGEEIAERYVAHEIVEAKSALGAYVRDQVPLGHKPPSKREVREIAEKYDAAIAKWGSEFGEQYGWAAHHLKNKRPNLANLEASTGRAAMRSNYKMASYNVHATPKGVFFKLGLIEPRSSIIAGASNVGFADPGQNTAFTLCTVTGLLFGAKMSLDDLIVNKVLVKLRDESAKAFGSADKRLIRDHRRSSRTQ